MNDLRTLLITGANTGIGAAAAAQLAKPGVRMILARRAEAPSPLAHREDLARALGDDSVDACAEGGGDAQAA